MFKFALVALLCAQAYAWPTSEINPLVVGGEPANEGQFPYVVSVRLTSGSFICGGALISDRYVLTAAHCVMKRPRIKIGVGSVNLKAQKFYEVEKFYMHPLFDATLLKNDVAIIKIKTPVKLSDTVKIINLPNAEDLSGKTVTALGWGFTSENGNPSSILMHLDRKIMPFKECKKKLEKLNEVFDSQICTENKRDYGMCFGDSGSPLVYKGPDGKDYAAGIVSWIIPCARAYPDVFTKVSSFIPWIKEKMV